MKSRDSIFLLRKPLCCNGQHEIEQFALTMIHQEHRYQQELLPVTEATILKLFPVHFIKRYILASQYIFPIYIYFLHVWTDMRTVALYFKGILDSNRHQPAAEFHQCIYVNNEEMDILFGHETTQEFYVLYFVPRAAVINCQKLYKPLKWTEDISEYMCFFKDANVNRRGHQYPICHWHHPKCCFVQITQISVLILDELCKS